MCVSEDISLRMIPSRLIRAIPAKRRQTEGSLMFLKQRKNGLDVWKVGIYQLSTNHPRHDMFQLHYAPRLPVYQWMVQGTILPMYLSSNQSVSVQYMEK